MITGLAHACFLVKDLDVAIAFYQEKLGFTYAFDYKNEQGERFGVYLHLGGRGFIEMFQGKLAEPAAGQSFQHICLEVDDLESTVAKLRAEGIEVSEPRLGLDRSWQAWFPDPDGNKIELHQYTPESKQGPFLA